MIVIPLYKGVVKLFLDFFDFFSSIGFFVILAKLRNIIEMQRCRKFWEYGNSILSR